jgi:outer membrane receptor protein involved in Fe transport
VPSNSDLKWETRKNYDVGIDVSFFKSKLNFTADYYIGRTTDMIIQTALPLSAGKTENAYVNGGEMENRGIEFEVSYQKKEGIFSYELSANFAASRNEVISTDGQNRRADGIEAGLPVFSLFGMKTNGIIKTNDVLINYPQHEFAELGDIWKEDINGDGKVDANDYTFIGKTYPDFTYGLSGSIGYKRLTLQCSLLGVQGFDLYTQGMTLSYFESNPQNQDIRILDRWSATENPNGNMPRITKADPSKNIGDVSDFWLSSASFLRINNLNIKYEIPETICNKMMMKYLEVYGSVQNLYTFTKFPGPEVDVTPGDVYATIPQPRSWVVGIKVTF